MSNAGPGERLRANRLTDWTMPACRILEAREVTHIVNCRDGMPIVFHGETQLTYGSLWAESAALAYMSAGRHDVRPHMLLAYFGQVSESTEAAIAYGRRYLAAWCTMVGIGKKWGFAIPFAASDALAILYWGRNTRNGVRITVADRAKTLKIAPRNYSLLRAKAIDVYRLRLAEAIVQFECALMKMERLAPANLHTQSRNTGLPARGSEFLARRAA